MGAGLFISRGSGAMEIDQPQCEPLHTCARRRGAATLVRSKIELGLAADCRGACPAERDRVQPETEDTRGRRDVNFSAAAGGAVHGGAVWFASRAKPMPRPTHDACLPFRGKKAFARARNIDHRTTQIVDRQRWLFVSFRYLPEQMTERPHLVCYRASGPASSTTANGPQYSIQKSSRDFSHRSVSVVVANRAACSEALRQSSVCFSRNGCRTENEQAGKVAGPPRNYRTPQNGFPAPSDISSKG